MRADVVFLCVPLAVVCLGEGQGAGISRNFALEASASAHSAASQPDGKYGTSKFHDNSPATHWASQPAYALPHWVKLEWKEPVTIDTVVVDIFARRAARLYAYWREAEVELSGGQKQRVRFADGASRRAILRFDPPARTTWLTVRILSVHERKRYLGISEVGAYLDPRRLIKPRKGTARAKPREALEPQDRPSHPTVYVNAEDLARARRNARATEWGKATQTDILKAAARWLEHDEAHWLQFLPPPGACYAYGFTGCPICNSRCGTWAGTRCAWDRPRTVACVKGHVLPDNDHPDDGTGYVAKDKRVHYIIGQWHAWVTEQWTLKALPSLAHAYALTGDERYAERAAFFFDALASIYAESTSGSWDYPSRPPSGRFARPWYQVARTLVVFVDAYDLIYSSKALDKPSLRPALEARWPKGPTPQRRFVRTPDARGQSRQGMTRRENIDLNLMQDAAYYCYARTFAGMLHNGHADYMRGALAVGALLGIPEYVHNSVESPYSIYAMLANNCDRDGRYYETSLGYALHARSLYLTFVEPLRNWRCERYPKGVDLFADQRMRSFYQLPDLVLNVAGHSPNFGDSGPDNRCRSPSESPFSARDYEYAERLYAGSTGELKEAFGSVLGFLSGGDVELVRKTSRMKRWLLYHADPVAKLSGKALDADLRRRVFGSWFLGQKGIAILRDGRGRDAQAAFLRFGPSLNHGDLDDLGLIYYGKGWQLTYEIGYGLGSTHVQVGWASQTASHTLVTVNEASQRGGSGGSLHLFADLPGIKVVEADSPLSYASQDVTQYRRTVALVGAGRDQYLIDLFRVRGGRQHDYGIGVQSQELEVSGITLGPEEEGSLAGLEHAWGEKIGPDGDIIGFPGKPYWRAPPGNGYGFFYDMRRASAQGTCRLDWAIGGPSGAHFRVHVLPEPATEIITTKAPGLYPHNRSASYVLARRRGPKLASSFATVMEPYVTTAEAEGTPWNQLLARLCDRSGEIKLLPGLETILLKGTKVGDHMTFELDVPTDGDHAVSARILQAPSYGNVRLLVDGKQLGSDFCATHDPIVGPVPVRFGVLPLTKGKHKFRFEIAPGSKAFFVSIGSLAVMPAKAAEPAEPVGPTPILVAADRVKVDGGGPEVTPIGVHVQRPGRDEYLFSAGLDESEKSAQTAAGEVRWRGAVVFLAVEGGEAASLATVGAWDVRVAGKPWGPKHGVFRGKVAALDYEQRWVEIDAALPSQGWDGAGVYFSSPGYSRATAYRIYGIERAGERTRIQLGPQPMLLGRGRVHQLAPGNVILSDIPHEYGRSVVGGRRTGFFDGKLVRGPAGVATRIKSVEFGVPMTLRVESIEGFTEGDTLYYYDVHKGDDVTLPLSWHGPMPGAK